VTTTLTPDLVESGPQRRGTGTLRYAGSKAGGALISLLMVIVLGFFLFRVMPGDPVKTITRDAPVGPKQLAELRTQLGLDKPIPAQFADYLAQLARGDLGASYRFRAPVSSLIAQRIGPTLLLVGVATAIAIVLGLWLGTLSAWRHGSRFDRSSTGVALVLWSAPTFWLGLVVLTATGDLFPSQGMIDADTPPGFLPQTVDLVHHMILPVLTLVVVLYAQYLLVMRSSLVEEMNADYLTTARAKGLRDDEVRRRHAVRNAMLPTVTRIFLNRGLVFSGAVTVETVFSWPGLGLLTYQALQGPDLPLLQGIFIVLAAIVLVMNLLADLLYRVIDPRVRAA
jgi:peptide/nickel transport system permease protein